MLDRYFPIYILAFLLTMLLTAILERLIIPYLKKKAKQPIYEEGPRWHVKKSGTPTMGGIGFLFASLITLLLCSMFLFFFVSKKDALSLLIGLLFALANALIGIIDDRKKLAHKKNQGLTPRQKLVLQISVSVLFLMTRKFLLSDTTKMSFSFGEVDFGFFYYPICIFLLVGLINSANLTDGIDGLASSVAFAIGISLFYVSASLNVESSIISATVIGAAVGFLFFNLHPAKIFMGDTGSLFFGAVISSVAFSLNNPLLLLFVSGVYIIEGTSVILQVGFYKLTHKRIFKMAPLHHHLEKCGFSENRICIIAMITTFILSVPAYIFYLP